MRLDLYSNPHPVCPHCAAKMLDPWDLDLDEDDDTEVECGACEKPYTVTKLVRITYTTAATDDEGDDDATT